MPKPNISLIMAIAAFAVSPALSQEAATYTYDALGRLTGAQYSGGPRAGKQNSLSYDPAGNRTAQAYGVALPNATPAQFSVTAPAPVTEGQAAVFTISKTLSTGGPVSVNFATTSGTASSPGDFTATSGTLTFLAWETVKTVAVQTLIDSVGEPAEQFSMTLSSPTAPSLIAVGSANVTIAANGPPNQPPVTSMDTVTLGQCSFNSVNPALNDTDPEGNTPLSVISVQSSPHFSSVISTTSPNLVSISSGSTAGSWIVSYTIRDSLGASSNGSLRVTIVNNGGCGSGNQ